MKSKKVSSRRSAIRTMGAGTVAALGATAIAGCAEDKTLNRIPYTEASMLALCGDESHNSDYIRSGLGKVLVQEEGYKVDFTDEEKLVTYDNLQHYKVLIIFRDGLRFPDGYNMSMYWNPRSQDEIVSEPPMEPIKMNGVAWMTEQQGKDIKRWVEEGGSLWAWHNNSQASLMNEDYHDVEGAVYAGHPPIRPFRVNITNPDHPITQGVNSFVVTDEQHYVRYDADEKHVLARSMYEGDGPTYTDNFGTQSPSCQAAWAYDYGKGRVCFLAPGHMCTALWNPEYKKMQKNAAKWLLRET